MGSLEIWKNFDEQVHTIPQLLYNNQANFGARPANMYFENNRWRTISYNELVAGLENISMGLIKLGIQPGDLVGIKATSSVRWTWADIGSYFAGASTVSIYPSLSPEETTTIVNHSQIKLLFVDNRERLFSVMSYLDRLPTVQYLVCLEKGFKGDGKNIFGLGEIIGMGFEMRPAGLAEVKQRVNDLTEDSPATLVYTSGITGALKGAMHSHKSLIWAASRGFTHMTMYGRAEDCNMVSMIALPLSHIMEKINSYLGPVAVGACLGFGQSPGMILADINMIRPTWVTWVPRLMARVYLGFQQSFCATELGKKAWDWAIDVGIRATYALEDADGYIDMTIPFEEQLPSPLREEWVAAYDAVFWRIHHALGGRMVDLNLGGAYMDPDLQRKMVGMGIYLGLGYGLTESAAGIVESVPNAYKIGWISPPNPGVEFHIEDDGELLIRGHGIITEYYKNEEATRESFTEDGWFRTGDIVEEDARGYIRVVDRKKAIIVLDTGKNVAQARVEALCDKCGLLDQAVIIGQDRKYIAALLVPNFEVIINVMRGQSIPFDESKLKYGMVNGMNICVEVGEDIITNPILMDLIKGEVAKVNEQLEDYETIKKFKLLSRRLSEEAGEITPSQKMKMKVVLTKYKDLVEEIYQ
ncbi:MAG: AMP-binding protein [Bacillota bacterium]|nr:AMP-binding protein [Bacillota bacterium]